jgi:DNA-binding PadR family transcriptional regulator
MTSQAMKLHTVSSRNPAEFAVMGALDFQDSHGYKLVAFLQENLSGICCLGRSQIYALLTKLEHEGLTVHERVEQSNLPSKKVFRLTQDGRNELHQWIITPVSNLRDLRIEFLIKIFFTRLGSQDAELVLLSKQLEVCKSKRSRLIELRSGAPNRIDQEALEYRISMAQAACVWLETLIKQTSNPANKSVPA